MCEMLWVCCTKCVMLNSLLLGHSVKGVVGVAARGERVMYVKMCNEWLHE